MIHSKEKPGGKKIDYRWDIMEMLISNLEKYSKSHPGRAFYLDNNLDLI